MKKYYIIKHNYPALFRDIKGELSTRKAKKLRERHGFIIIEKQPTPESGDKVTNAYTFDEGTEAIWREKVGQFVVWDYTSPLMHPLIHIGDKVMTFSEYNSLIP